MQSVDHDFEIRRLEGQIPPMERYQWLLGPALLLAVLLLATVTLAITGRL
jgi:hypothetical protein